MSVADYARFLDHWFGAQRVYGAGSPIPLRLDLGGGADYGLGMFERNVSDHRNFWHFGLWCVPDVVNAGAFAVRLRRDWNVVASFDACLDWDALGALDSAISRVVYAR